jgi:hypothetical protein
MTNATTITKKFESLFFRRIEKTLRAKVDGLISSMTSFDDGRRYLSNMLTNPEFVKEMQRLYGVVGFRWANITMRSLRQAERGRKSMSSNIETKGFGFNEQWTRFIEGYLKNHIVDKLTFNVTATLKEYLLNVLNRAVEQGWGVDKTVKFLREESASERSFTKFQAARIVRTEVNRASNAGVMAAGDTYEYQMTKEWISVHDKRTRGVDPKDHASHIALDGVKIDFEDVFTDPVNGDQLIAPGDPKASAASTINCRCQLALAPKRDARGRLIPKRQSTVVIYPNRSRRQTVITI